MKLTGLKNLCQESSRAWLESVVFYEILPFRDKMYKHLAPIARRFIPGRGGGNYSAADYIHCWALIRKDLVRTGAESAIAN